MGKVHPALEMGWLGSPSLVLRLSFVGRNEEITICLKSGEQMVLGRAVPMASLILLDLSPYGAHELGVSRKHAAIVVRGSKRAHDAVWITDMGSANGTYLNGQRITPKIPRRLCNADEICLGYLRIRVHFKQIEASFLEHIRLYNPSSKSVWGTNQQTWAEALELAEIFGCQATRGPGDGTYGPGVCISDEDAQALADALAHALPHLPDVPPRVIAGRLDSQPIEPPVRYFGGQAGKQKIRELITFCRQGGFKVETR